MTKRDDSAKKKTHLLGQKQRQVFKQQKQLDEAERKMKEIDSIK